jgi:formylglycine-generating enzyme required for sulfatase activity
MTWINKGYPATVSTFGLDKYEITVGRFRQFVDAGHGTRAQPPASGAGGRTLNGMANQGGWEPAWNANLEAGGDLRHAVV